DHDLAGQWLKELHEVRYAGVTVALAGSAVYSDQPALAHVAAFGDHHVEVAQPPVVLGRDGDHIRAVEQGAALMFDDISDGSCAMAVDCWNGNDPVAVDPNGTGDDACVRQLLRRLRYIDVGAARHQMDSALLHEHCMIGMQ